MSTTDGALAEATGIAQALTGGAVKVSRLATGGRNSRIWRVASGDRAFALKQYPSRRDDPRDRLATEVGALRLMERHGIDTVPRVLGVDGAHGFALLSWIDGRDVVEVSDSDIDAAIVFLTAIHGLRAAPWAAEQHRQRKLASTAARSNGRFKGAWRACATPLVTSMNLLISLIIPSRRGLRERVRSRVARRRQPALLLTPNSRRNGAASFRPTSAFTTACAGRTGRWHSSISSILAGTIL